MNTTLRLLSLGLVGLCAVPQAYCSDNQVRFNEKLDATQMLFDVSIDTNEERHVTPAIERHAVHHDMKAAVILARRSMSPTSDKRFEKKYWEALNRSNAIKKAVEFKRSLLKNNDKFREEDAQRDKRRQEKEDRKKKLATESNAALKALARPPAPMPKPKTKLIYVFK